ncbi:MAG: heavy metal translocating P-type ATPase, partial [Armatimonadota bacterium]
GALEVSIEKTGDETYLSQVIKLVEAAQESKSRSQDLANRAAFWLTIVALSVGAATLVVWLVAHKGFDFALERAITVMVITCPHALGLAVPLVVAVSTAIAAKRGLLIRDRAAFERSRRLDAVVFDKTGTLTEGRFGVETVQSFNAAKDDEVLRLAAGVEAHSEHPIARGILRGARERGLSIPPVTDFQAIAGKGAQGRVEGRAVKVVSPAYVEEERIQVPAEAARDASGTGRTLAYVLADEEPIGLIGLGDVIRPESREAIERLHALGIRAMMLTGDNETVARWVAGELGLDEYFAGVLPHQKAERIKEIQGRGVTVGMVGDGVNDAPALVQADVGIAIGAGTDVAIESADIVLVKNDPRAVTDMLALAQATWKKMAQNLAWATGYNLVAIPLAAGVLYAMGVLLSPAVGAVLMSASTVIVAINARLLRLPE